MDYLRQPCEPQASLMAPHKWLCNRTRKACQATPAALDLNLNCSILC